MPGHCARAGGRRLTFYIPIALLKVILRFRTIDSWNHQNLSGPLSGCLLHSGVPMRAVRGLCSEGHTTPLSQARVCSEDRPPAGICSRSCLTTAVLQPQASSVPCPPHFIVHKESETQKKPTYMAGSRDRVFLSLRKLGLDGLPLEQESLLLLVTVRWAWSQPDGVPLGTHSALLPTQGPFIGKLGECYPNGLMGELRT